VCLATPAPVLLNCRDLKPENCLLAKPAAHYAAKNKPVKVRMCVGLGARVHPRLHVTLGVARGARMHTTPACCTQTRDTQVKLIDLGMAGLFRPTRPAVGCMGSPGFIAPEVVLGGQHTVRAPRVGQG
jgi:serine/threonine protein kinase